MRTRSPRVLVAWGFLSLEVRREKSDARIDLEEKKNQEAASAESAYYAQNATLGNLRGQLLRSRHLFCCFWVHMRLPFCPVGQNQASSPSVQMPIAHKTQTSVLFFREVLGITCWMWHTACFRLEVANNTFAIIN